MSAVVRGHHWPARETFAAAFILGGLTRTKRDSRSEIPIYLLLGLTLIRFHHFDEQLFQPIRFVAHRNHVDVLLGQHLEHRVE